MGSRPQGASGEKKKKHVLTLTCNSCIFSHAHAALLESPTTPSVNKLASGLRVVFFLLFNKCNCKTTRPRGRCESTARAIARGWVALGGPRGPHLTPKILTRDQCFLWPRPLLFQVSLGKSGVMFQWFP